MESLEQRIIGAWLRINTALRKQAWSSSDRLGLTPTQVEILLFLKRRDGVKLSDIASFLSLTPATVSDSASALVKKGLVLKKAAAENARAIAVYLTEAGVSAASAAEQWTLLFADSLRELDDAEKQVMFKALIKVVRSLQAKGAVSVSRMCVDCRYFMANRYPDSAAPHHCSLVDAPLKEEELRIDCPEHEPSDIALQEKQWALFLKPVFTAPNPGKDEV